MRRPATSTEGERASLVLIDNLGCREKQNQSLTGTLCSASTLSGIRQVSGWLHGFAEKEDVSRLMTAAKIGDGAPSYALLRCHYPTTPAYVKLTSARQALASYPATPDGFAEALRRTARRGCALHCFARLRHIWLRRALPGSAPRLAVTVRVLLSRL